MDYFEICLIYCRKDDERTVLGILEMKEVEMNDDEISNNVNKRQESVAAFNNQVWFMHNMLF